MNADDLTPRADAPEPGEYSGRAGLVAEHMRRLYGAASTVHGLAAWTVRPSGTVDPGTRMMNLIFGPTLHNAEFARIMLETSDGALLLDQVADLYAARLLSLHTCLHCLCQNGGVLVRGTAGEYGSAPFRVGPFDDVVFALGFEDDPRTAYAALGSRFELRDVIG